MDWYNMPARLRVRYGSQWTEWRKINENSANYENEAILDLGLNADRKITWINGMSHKGSGQACSLMAQTSDGEYWDLDLDLNDWRDHPDVNERPSPSSPAMVLSHLSGNSNSGEMIQRFHWRLQ